MAKDLIIVESPTKAKTLSKFLGKNYTIKASMGHIRDLPKKELGIDIEKGFTPKYVTDRGKAKIIKQLKESAKNSEAIYLAPDHDREGEAIAWHLQYLLKDVTGNKKVYRIVFNEITQRAIMEALQHPGTINNRKVDSQQARRILDRLVGYTISPLLWKVISGGLSAGRVQSVALRIICEREQEIIDFVQKKFWSIEADFFKDGYPPFHAVLQSWKGGKVVIHTQEEADKLLEKVKTQTFSVTDRKVSSRKVQPLPPFITSTLQQEANRILNFSSKKTMIVAQQLYEGVDIKGEPTALISYMRTDSLRVSQEALNDIKSLISEEYGEDKLNSSLRRYKNKSSAQDAHEAIRPTNVFQKPDDVKPYLSAEQFRLYSLIWKRTVATQMKPATVQTISIEITGGEALFKASGGTIEDKGFLEVYEHYSINLGEKIDPAYSIKDEVEHKELKGHQHFTKPPARYTEATLIKELESKGIGRPSTYAAITTTILERKYVQLAEKKFSPTELGKTVNKFLVDRFDNVFNVEFTKKLEDKLDEIAEGKTEWQSLLADYYSKIDQLIKGTDIRAAKQTVTEETELLCDKCGSPMVIKWGKRGQFLACSAFPKCSNIKSFHNDKDGNVKIDTPEHINEKCPEDGGELLIKNSRYGKFIGCSNYPKCKYTRKITTGVKCPDCEKGEIVEKKDKKGKTFFSCSAYPECKFTSNRRPKGAVCPKCDNHYLEETPKSMSSKYQCPKCKTEFS